MTGMGSVATTSGGNGGGGGTGGMGGDGPIASTTSAATSSTGDSGAPAPFTGCNCEHAGRARTDGAPSVAGLFLLLLSARRRSRSAPS
jgi:hypothetical protein